jgi:putative cardiolipin synthase
MAQSFDQKIVQVGFRLELKTDETEYDKILWHGLVDGEQRVFEVDPYTGFWERFGIGFMKILPIESLL